MSVAQRVVSTVIEVSAKLSQLQKLSQLTESPTTAGDRCRSIHFEGLRTKLTANDFLTQAYHFPKIEIAFSEIGKT